MFLLFDSQKLNAKGTKKQSNIYTNSIMASDVIKTRQETAEVHNAMAKLYSNSPNFQNHDAYSSCMHITNNRMQKLATKFTFDFCARHDQILQFTE